MESAGEHQSKTVALRSGQTTLVVEGPVRSFGTFSLFRISPGSPSPSSDETRIPARRGGIGKACSGPNRPFRGASQVRSGTGGVGSPHERPVINRSAAASDCLCVRTKRASRGLTFTHRRPFAFAKHHEQHLWPRGGFWVAAKSCLIGGNAVVHMARRRESEQ